MAQRSQRLPLLPLTDAVHFPRTELSLQVVEPRCRTLVEEVYASDEVGGRIGTVLVKPDGVPRRDGESELCAAGTAGRLVHLQLEPDGSCTVLLYGEFRFEVVREVRGGPYREALVRPLVEPCVIEEDPGVAVVRRDLVRCIASIAGELGDRFVLEPRQLRRLVEVSSFEELVNRLAAHLDLEPLRKLALLSDPLPQRAVHLLSILRRRLQVLDLLRPFRRAAGNHELN